MELSWEWEKMDELNFVVLVLSAMLPMLVAYSTHQIAHDEEEDMNDMMAELERRKRRQIQSELVRQKELQYTHERKQLKASLAKALREEERMKINDLYNQRHDFAHDSDPDDESVYEKAKYNVRPQKDLTEKFVMSKQYNSANFAPVRDKSGKSFKQPENKVNTKESQITNFVKETQNFQQESKLKTTPKITKPVYLDDEKVEVKSKIELLVQQERENFSKRFMQEIKQEGKQEPEREIVFNFVPKKDATSKTLMQEETTPQKVAGGYKIACAHCGKETIKKSKTAKYCSTACRVAHNKAAGMEDDGKSSSFYLVKDDFDKAGVIEWANSESL
jgi:hypothetical protein